jgi:DnaJ like chaperone protein
VLRFRTDPLEVLGLDSTATDQDIRQAYEQAMEENDPAKVADMATEIRELAARRQREVQAAYSQLCSEE